MLGAGIEEDEGAPLSLLPGCARKKVGRRVEALLFTIIFHKPVNRPDPKGPSQAPLREGVEDHSHGKSPLGGWVGVGWYTNQIR